MAERADDVEATIRRLYRDVELAVRQATILVGHDGLIVSAHKAGLLFGLADADLIGQEPVPDGWSLHDASGTSRPSSAHPALRAMRHGETVEEVVEMTPATGDPVRLRLVAHPVDSDPDVAVDIVVELESRRPDSRQRLVAQEHRFQTLADMLPVAVYEASPTGEITYINPAFTRLTGYEVPTDVPDLPMLQIVHPDDLVSVLEVAGQAPEAGQYEARYRVRHLDGSARWVTSRLSLIIDRDGKLTGYVGAIEDVDDLQRAEAESRQLADIVESASDPVVLFEDGRLTYLNPAARVLVARTEAGQGADRSVAALLESLRVPALDEALDERGEGRWNADIQLRGRDGAPIDISVSVTASRSADGTQRMVVIGHDIGERKRREDVLAHDATHDPLTGLANRTLLDRRVSESADDGGMIVAFYADIDGFKTVNDTHGHAVGDAAIVAIAERISSVVRSGDLVARTGGDEIVGWCTSLGSDRDVSNLADRLVEVVRADPVIVDGRALELTISVGVATNTVAETRHLLGLADRALYEAKQTGRDRWAMAPNPDAERGVG